MVFELTEEIFEKNKKETLKWLEENWTWNTKYMVYLDNMLSAIRGLIEEWKRE